MEEIEEWKECEDFPGQLVSNLGRVKSIDRYVNSKGNSKRFIKGKLHDLCTDSEGYSNVTCGTKTTRVHRLVAKAFIPNPLNLPQVNHKDTNKKNCKANNLEWCTCSYNGLHASKNNLLNNGEKHYSVTLSTKTVAEIREKYKTGKYTQLGLAKEYGISQSGIFSIVNNKTRNNG